MAIYDPNKDYTTEIKNAIARGASAAEVNALNDQRNAKIAASGGALSQYKDDVKDLVASYAKGMNSYFPSSGGTSGIPSGYVGNANVTTGKVTAPDGKTQLDMHDWATDTTDYSTLMQNAKTAEEFNKYAQDRVSKATAQGIVISQGNASGYKSNQDIYDTWYAKNGPQVSDYIINGQIGRGYYGMDGNGNWGYYDDPALTQKSANGGWDSYRSSDGGPATFVIDSAGRLTPSMSRDTSRAGQTVTVASGNTAYQVEYDALGYAKSVRPVDVDPSTLQAAQYDPSRDQGVSGRDLLLRDEGVSYAGPGASIDTSNLKPGSTASWNAIIEGRGNTGTGNTGSTGGNANTTGGVTSVGSAYNYDRTGGNGGTPTGSIGDAGTSSGGGSGGTAVGQSGYDLTEYLRQQQAAALEAQLAGLKSAYERSMNGYNDQLERLPQAYNAARNATAAQDAIARRAFDERAAAMGLNSGTAGQAELARSAAYQSALSGIDQQQANAESDLRLTIANLTAQYENAIAQARASGDAQLAQSLYNELIRVQGLERDDANIAWNRDYQLSRDAISDARYDQQWAYQQEQDAYNRQLAADQLAYQRQQDEYTRQIQQAQLGAQLGDYSGYSALGYDTSGVTQSTAKPTLTAAQVNAAIKAGNLTPNVLSGYEYYYGVPYGEASGTASGTTGGTASSSRVSWNNGGLTSAQVKDLQGHLGVTPDGYFGPASQAAAKTKYGTTSADEAYNKAFGGGTTAVDYGSLRYSPDEGVFYWGGRAYSSKAALSQAVDSAYSSGKITEADAQRILNSANAYGISFAGTKSGGKTNSGTSNTLN